MAEKIKKGDSLESEVFEKFNALVDEVDNIKENGGSSGGMAEDSAKLGGKEPSYYLDYNNLKNKPSISGGNDDGTSAVVVIDVEGRLPYNDSNVNRSAFYRLTTYKYYTLYGGRPPLDSKKNNINGYTVEFVEVAGLPTSGKVFKDDSALKYTIYRVIDDDQEYYGYSNGAWTYVGLLFDAMGIWGGIINEYRLGDVEHTYIYSSKVYIVVDRQVKLYYSKQIRPVEWVWEMVNPSGIVDVDSLPKESYMANDIEEDKIYRLHDNDKVKLYNYSRKTFKWQEIGAGVIIDVNELPSVGNENAIYRLSEEEFALVAEGMYIPNGTMGVKIFAVDELPSVGEPVQTEYGGMNVYYKRGVSDLFGYMDGYGWINAEAMGYSFGGIISSVEEVTDVNLLYLVIGVRPQLYNYKDGWDSVGVRHKRFKFLSPLAEKEVGDEYNTYTLADDAKRTFDEMNEYIVNNYDKILGVQYVNDFTGFRYASQAKILGASTTYGIRIEIPTNMKPSSDMCFGFTNEGKFLTRVIDDTGAHLSIFELFITMFTIDVITA